MGELGEENKVKCPTPGFPDRWHWRGYKCGWKNHDEDREDDDVAE